MNNLKIIFAGPVGAGKTTAIASISDIPPIGMDESAFDAMHARKEKTNVAMDYGMMKLSGGERIHLYGTPGQERFNSTWDILSAGGIGLILLINNSRPDPFKDMAFFLGAFDAFIKETQVAIGVTQMDISKRPAIDEYHTRLGAMGLSAPVFDVDARSATDVSILVQALILALDPGGID